MALALAMLLVAILACHSESRPRSDKSFDEICRLVSGKTAAEVEAILGKPNTHEKLPLGDLRYVWWNYTALKGDNYPPEVRDKPVHLEIMFSSQAAVPESQWRVGGPLAVSFALPQVPATGAM
ncbi:MAG TPA: hypothetical protein VF173_02245 [Thermoanaerobaculia bacterium]|nr:hypothetical protein [Thermoanaerobaculia bacterium]